MTLGQYITPIPNKKFIMSYFVNGNGGVTTENVSFSLSDSVETDDGAAWEWQYALLEHGQAEELLSLEIGDTMFFQMDRDDKREKAIIIRIE